LKQLTCLGSSAAMSTRAALGLSSDHFFNIL
jgi:hypothetical protein